MRVLVFGASITQGFWDTEGGWVQRLRRHYDQRSVKNIQNEDDYPDIFNLGIYGNTSSDLLARFDNEASARLRPNTKNGLILFSIGTNNAYVEANKAWPGTSQFKKDLAGLISKARVFTDKVGLVEQAPCEESKTTPVFWRDISYTNQRIAEVNRAINEIAEKEKTPVIEVFSKMKAAMDDGQELFTDGLHPSNDGHQFIFELVQPALDELLNS